MIKKIRASLVLILVCLGAFYSSISSTGLFENNSQLADIEAQVDGIELAEFQPNAIDPPSLTNGTVHGYFGVTYGTPRYFVLEDVPFNSAKYRVRVTETFPAEINVDVYVKFYALPTTSSWDYKASTANSVEEINVEIPEDDAYGDMYIMVISMSGSSYITIQAYYVSDSNGCWRSADPRTTPTYGTPTVIGTSLVSPTDLNDFFKIYLYSGTRLRLDFTVATSGTSYVDMFLYNEYHTLLAYDTSGTSLDISYNITSFNSGYYYLRFKCMDNTYHSYSGTIYQDNSDTNNDPYDTPTHLVDGTNFGGMNYNDFNDYWYFDVDCSEHVTITVTMIDTLSNPYYSAFIYDDSNPVNTGFIISDYGSKTLTLEFYSSDYYTSDISPYTQNRYYLRIYNLARSIEAADCSSSYTINFAHTFPNANDRLSTCYTYTYWGTNDTSIKTGSLSGVADVHDWFRISTKVGYTIKIAFNSTDPIPSPYLDGYLYNSAGVLVASDTSFNITITYTATYTGNYYFRLYERCAQHTTGYIGESDYSWYIYTSSYDGNDDFETATNIEEDTSIVTTVSAADTDDYYKIMVPSGFILVANGTCNPTDVDLILYDENYTIVDSDSLSPWDTVLINGDIDPKQYYIHVSNVMGHAVVNYNLNLYLIKIDDNDDAAGATDLGINTGDSAAGSGTIGFFNVNDFYSFDVIAGDLVTAKVTVAGNGAVLRLIKLDSEDNEIILDEEISVDSVEMTLTCLPNAYYMSEKYYLRIVAPWGVPLAGYEYNVTITEDDTVDGYFYYSNILDAQPNNVITESLSATDQNDWYYIGLPSAANIEVTLTTTSGAPYFAGMQFFSIFTSGIYQDSQTLTVNAINPFYYDMNIYIQIVNDPGINVEYTLEITIDYIDSDDNSNPENPGELILDEDQMNSVGLDDINDLYAVEIRSGYNFTVKFDSSNILGYPMYCLFVTDSGVVIASEVDTSGSFTISNPNLDSIKGYVMFWNAFTYIGLNATEAYIEYSWNATLVLEDPDGDFDRAIVIEETPYSNTDTMFADVVMPEYNISDINDFYVIDLKRDDTLIVNITITGLGSPWFGVYIYDENQQLIASVTGGDDLDLSLVVNASGLYYIRIYNAALDAGGYTLNVNKIIGHFLLQDFLFMPIWAWIAAGSGLLLVILSIIIAVAVKKKRVKVTR